MQSGRSSLFSVIGHLLRWSFLALPVAVLAGSASAFFLWALGRVTQLQWEHPQLLWLLPGGGVPARMAPLVLLGTLVTHLCGGSAERESTAVQMGGSLTAMLARWFRVTRENRCLMLMCGLAAGLSNVRIEGTRESYFRSPGPLQLKTIPRVGLHPMAALCR